MSYNHQFIQFEPIKRFVKTVTHRVTGYRLDPSKTENQIDWLLSTPDSNFNFETKKVKGFDYEEEVLELYTAAEVKLFERLNRKLIEEGTLKVYTGDRDVVDLSNMLSDEEVDEVAGIRQTPAIKKRLQTITSIASLNRIKTAAEELNRPLSIIKAIDERINDFKTENTE